MKKNIIYLAALAMLTVACSNEDDTILPGSETGSTDEVRMITETITATNGDAAGSASTRAEVADNAMFTWSASDHVAAHLSNGEYTVGNTGSGGSNSAEFSVSYPEGASRDAFAVFPSSIVNLNATNYGQSGKSLDVTLPKEYDVTEVMDHITPCPMIADNTGSSWTFKQLCGLLRLTITNIPSGTDYLKLDFNGRKVSGDFSIASPVTPGTSTIQSVAGTKGTDDYIMITGLGDETSCTVNIPLPTGTAYSGLIVSAWDDNGTTEDLSDDKPLKAQATPFTYTASRAKGKKLTSALNPLFSIASGKYAVFAPGNLQYNKSTGIWSFMDNQYDMAETASQNVGTDYASQNIVSLFGWGTQTTPYNTSTTHTDYSWNEWGDNVIDGYAAGTWRTLTGGGSGEWKYLLESRTATTKYCKATVNSVSGLVIFPDSYTHPTGVTAVASANDTDAAYTSNSWSDDNWTAMEAAGAVFLPAAGYRSGTTVTSDVGTYAYYWSSTIGDNGVAKCVNFSSITLSAESAFYRGNGCSVRLVHPVE